MISRALALVVAAVLAAGCGAGEEGGVAEPAAGSLSLAACPVPATPAAEEGTLLPDLTLPCLAGGDPVPLRRLTGTPTVVNLWASWCGPCQEELPAFARLHRAGADRVRVLGVVTQDRRAAAETYASDHALPFGSVVDPDGKVMRALGPPRLPLTVLLDAGGTIVHSYAGPPLTDAALRRLVRERLRVDVR